jgi:hypothetical protein
MHWAISGVKKFCFNWLAGILAPEVSFPVRCSWMNPSICLLKLQERGKLPSNAQTAKDKERSRSELG